MKHPLILALALVGSLALTAAAQDKEPAKKGPTPEQKAARKELMDKYDKDKDGKLSKEEREAMSDEDKAKMKELQKNAGPKPAKKKQE